MRAPLAALALLLLAAAPARAQAPATDAARKAEAKKLAEDANRKYNLGQFDAALETYTKAYDTFPAAGLLFNLAQCHRSLKNHERAIFFYEGYLREKPNAPNRDVVEELLVEERGLLTRRKEAEAEAARKKAEDEAARKKAAEEEAARRRAAEDEERRRRSAMTTAGPGDPSGATAGLSGGVAAGSGGEPFFKKWWFWTAVGVGVGVLAGSTIYITQRESVLPAGSLGLIDGRGEQ